MRLLTFKYGEVTSPGGINKVIVKINSELAKFGNECIVITVDPKGFPNEEIYEGFKIIRIKTMLGSHFYGLNLGIFLYLMRHFKNLNPDVIHIHGYHGLLSPEVMFILKLLNKKKTPIIFSPHFGISSRETLAGKYLWKPFNYLIGRNTFKCPNINIVSSTFEANKINQVLNVPKSKIIVLPHGVDIIDLKKEKNKTNTIHLLCVSYLIKIKGVHYVIRALSELIHNNGVDVRLTIVGNGSYEGRLRELAKELSVNDYIYWKEFMSPEELHKQFKKADIFLLMSKSENYGIVVSESLALGTPAIVAKTTSLNEFLNEPGCFGVDYPPDPKKVAEIILNIYKTNINVGPLSNKIRLWNKVTLDYLSVYSSSIKQIKILDD